MTEQKSTRRKDRPGIPKVAGLTGGAFAAQEHAEDDAVALAYDAQHPRGETWAPIEDARELREAIQLEQQLFDESVVHLNGDDPDFVGKLNRLSQESVEAYATVLERIDQSSPKYNRETFNDVWTRSLDLPLRKRIADFVSSWRVAENDDGTFTVLRGVHITGNEYSYDDRDAAEYRLERQVARDARSEAYPKLSAQDEDWDVDVADDHEDILDAFAKAKPIDAMNVSSVNPWNGMVRFERTGGDDIVVVDANEMYAATADILRFDSARLLNLGPDVLAGGGNRTELATRIAATPSLFGTLIGAKGDTEVIPTENGSVVRAYNVS
ncbi:hypothetical protein [Curtobacterium sp. MCSS17_016]|uniref:hypothetical protein n=1 Tax=Curtobacterium sp. MCSS17_016 TaxID=2175644 RepID=UPI0011B6261F|nr:hypothetical protein [Curtobacterium sp. MCSS17_016]WIE81145.1 hypothetical protein DEJ19_018100 [Curtobacterium sp. MCSS17_016]